MWWMNKRCGGGGGLAAAAWALAMGVLAIVGGCAHAERISHELSILDGDASLRYTILDGADEGKIAVTMERRSSRTSGWLAIAFGSSMRDAKAVIGALGSVDAVTLSSHSDGVLPCGSVLEDPSFTVTNKMMVLNFTASDICGEAFQGGGGDQEVMFAYDDSNSGAYTNRKHDAYEQVTLDWKLGLIRSGLNLFVLHGVMMLLAFAVLFPVGMIPAVHRHRFTSSESFWFKAHRGLQALAFLLAVVGTIAVVAGTVHLTAGVHQILGVAILSVLGLQIVFVFLRHNETLRQVWYASHMFFALVIVGGGLANCYLGLEALEGKVAEDTVDAITNFAYVGIAIGGIAALLTVFGFAVRPPKSEDANSSKVGA